jgi:hypothetical protein
MISYFEKNCVIKMVGEKMVDVLKSSLRIKNKHRLTTPFRPPLAVRAKSEYKLISDF